MREYQKRVNKLIQSLVSDILDGKLTNKKAINKALAKLSKDIGVPLNELKVRLATQAKDTSLEASHKIAKLLMAQNQDAVIKSMTADEVSIMVDKIFKGLLPFKKIKNGKTIDFAINVDDWFAYLGDDMVKKVKQGILGAYIDGSSPVEVARNLLRNTELNSKANRAKIKALTFTLVHKANETANLETFIKNERYIDWIKYQTAVDDRVDDVCEQAELESIQLKLKPTEYKEQRLAIPSLHVSCRCYIKAMTTMEDDSQEQKINSLVRKHRRLANKNGYSKPRRK